MIQKKALTEKQERALENMSWVDRIVARLVQSGFIMPASLARSVVMQEFAKFDPEKEHHVNALPIQIKDYIEKLRRTNDADETDEEESKRRPEEGGRKGKGTGTD